MFYNNGKTEEISFTPKEGYYNEFLNFYEGLIMNIDIETTPIIEFGEAKLVFDIIASIETGSIINVLDSTKKRSMLLYRIDLLQSKFHHKKILGWLGLIFYN